MIVAFRRHGQKQNTEGNAKGRKVAINEYLDFYILGS